MTDDATPIAPAHSTAWMSTHEALRLAKTWTDGQPLDDLPQWRTAIKVLADEIAAIRARAEAAEKAAARYHWLREYGNSIYADVFNDDAATVLALPDAGARLDAAIDAAIDAAEG